MPDTPRPSKATEVELKGKELKISRCDVWISSTSTLVEKRQESPRAHRKFLQEFIDRSKTLIGTQGPLTTYLISMNCTPYPNCDFCDAIALPFIHNQNSQQCRPPISILKQYSANILSHRLVVFCVGDWSSDSLVIYPLLFVLRINATISLYLLVTSRTAEWKLPTHKDPELLRKSRSEPFQRISSTAAYMTLLPCLQQSQLRIPLPDPSNLPKDRMQDAWNRCCNN